jgi:hypothetical protein
MSMSEDYDYLIDETDFKYYSHNDIRTDEWTMKNKSTIAIGSMIDSHLLNAYKKTGDKRLFKEMVVRLFEQRVARMTV